MDAYNVLTYKIKKFNKRVLLIVLLKGFIVFVSFTIFFTVLFSVLEFYFWFSPAVRLLNTSVIFLGGCFILFSYLIKPVFNYLKLNNYTKLLFNNALIASKYPLINDKIINTVELKNNSLPSYFSEDLRDAAVLQKSTEILNIDFEKAISYKEIKFTSVILSAILFISVLFTSIFPDNVFTGTKRLIHFTKIFSKPSPFQYKILNESFESATGEDFIFKVSFMGNNIPDKVYIHVGLTKYILSQGEDRIFSFVFKNLSNDLSFQLFASKYFLDNFKIKVYPSPMILSSDLFIEFPTYINRETNLNTTNTNLVIPSGSYVTWKIRTSNTDSIIFENQSISFSLEKNKDYFSYTQQINKNLTLNVSLKNQFTEIKNYITYTINIIPDLYPEIHVSVVHDTVNKSIHFFKGVITDDYGFSNLNMTIIDNILDTVVIPLQFDKNSTKQLFYYAYDFSEKYLNSEYVIYFFSIADNDYLNHYKKSSTENFYFKPPTISQVLQDNEQIDMQLMDQFFGIKQLTDQIKSQVNSLELDYKSKKISDFDFLKKMQELNSKNEKLKDQLNALEKQFKNTLNDKELSNELFKKQKELNDILNNIMDDELKKLLDEISKLSKNFDKTKLNDLLKKSDFTVEKLQKQLERSLELFKRFQIEKNIEDLAKNFEKLSQNENQLIEQIGKDSLSSLKEMQNKINEDYEALKNSYQKIENDNKSLENPFNLDDLTNDFKELDNNLKSDSSFMEQNNLENLRKGKKQVSQKFKRIAEKLNNFSLKNNLQQQTEDAEMIRQILENLLTLSFNEEKIIELIDIAIPNNPKYREIINKQRLITNSFEIVNDSIEALAKRNSQISSFISNELIQIKYYFPKILSQLDDGKINDSKVSAQFLMTSFNNLAVMLSESLKNIQDNMMSMGSGKSKNQKNKKQQNGMEGLKQQQNSLKNMLSKLLQDLKDGDKPGNQTSKQISEMLAGHEMLQQMLNQMINGSEIGSEATEILKQINQILDQNRKDLINKNINSVMMQRIDQIKSRLLEAEKAEKQRDQDNRRQSEENKKLLISNPKSIFEYNKEINNYNDIFKFEKLYLHPYYKNKVDQYIFKINSVN